MVKKRSYKAQLICKTRYNKQIGQISGIQFFISCVTGTTTNTKRSSNTETQEFESIRDCAI